MHSTKSPPHQLPPNLSRSGGTGATVSTDKLEISPPRSALPRAIGPRAAPKQQAQRSPNANFRGVHWRSSTLPNLSSSVLNKAPEAVAKPANPPSSSHRNSTVFSTPTRTQSSWTMDDSIKRGSGWRATIRRMLGSKRRKDSISTHHSNQTRPDNSADDSAPQSRRPAQKPASPMEDFLRGRALNSHAPRVPLPDQVESRYMRTSRGETELSGIDRRNSLPGTVLPSQRLELPAVATDSDVPHVATRTSSPKTNGMGKSLAHTRKRKSRSADALRDLVPRQSAEQAESRRLSDEIKYWRASVIRDPIPPFRAEPDDEDGRGGPAWTAPKPSPMPNRPLLRQKSQPVLEDPKLDRPGMVGDEASVEQRITTVEVKLVGLESAIVNLQGADYGPPTTTLLPSRGKRPMASLSRQGLPSTTVTQIVPKSSFDSVSTDLSTHPTDHDRSAGNRDSGTASTSAITFRPSPATVRPGALVGRSENQLGEVSHLIDLLDQEREARHALEMQLKELQQQVRQIQSTTVPPDQPTTNGPCRSQFHRPCHSARSSALSPALPSPSSSRNHAAGVTFPSAGGDLSAPYPPQSHHARTTNGLASRRETPIYHKHESTRPTDVDTDEDDDGNGHVELYATPTESRDFGFNLSAPASPGLMIGAV